MLGSRKAQMNFLAWVIIAVVSLSILLGGISLWASKLDHKGAESSCKASVDLRASTQIQAGNSEVNLGPLLCKTIDYGKIQGNNEEIKAELADKMARCWRMMGEGRYDDSLANLGLDNLYSIFNFPQNGNQCFLCSTIIVDEDDLDGGISEQEMVNYLIEEDYPRIKNETYVSYIQSHGGPGALAVLSPIEPNTAYGITYLSRNSDKGGWSWKGTAIGAGLAVGAIIVGAACVISVACAAGGAIASAASVTTTALSVSAGAALSYDAANNIYKVRAEFFDETERDVSSVALERLDVIQHSKCIRSDATGGEVQ